MVQVGRFAILTLNEIDFLGFLDSFAFLGLSGSNYRGH